MILSIRGVGRDHLWDHPWDHLVALGVSSPQTPDRPADRVLPGRPDTWRGENRPNRSRREK